MNHRYLRILTPLLAALTAVLLGGCDISLSVSNRTYIVDTDPGPGGDIDPRVKRVSSGGRASFRILPDAGFEIDSVSGCGGSLAGTHYTTERIWSDCVVRARFREAGPASISLSPEISHMLLYRGPADGDAELMIDDPGMTRQPSAAAARAGGACAGGAVSEFARHDSAAGSRCARDPLFRFYGPWEQAGDVLAEAGAVQGVVDAGFASLGSPGGGTGFDRHGRFSLRTTIEAIPAGGMTRTYTLVHEWVGHPQYLLIESVPQARPPGFDLAVRTRVLVTAVEAGEPDRVADGHEQGVTVMDERLDEHGRVEFHPPADSPLYALAGPVRFTMRVEQEISAGREAR
ncbi:hypothetical protein [Thioalkalivibrio sp.]|uniref:hypothetical protein n=1 Tax=Thioalkalivibrio sp. TaxID=2093813 RepID=UPI003565AD79